MPHMPGGKHQSVKQPLWPLLSLMAACLVVLVRVAVRLVKTVRKRSPQVQLLLFSASFNDRVKDFASRVAPSASQVFVPQQKLSLEVFRQYNVM